MQRGRVFVRRVTIGLALGAAISGCSLNLPVANLFNRKTAQCNNLINVANGAVGEVQAVMNTTNPNDVTALAKIADIADQTVAKLRSLDLQDSQLQQLRDRYVQMYADTSTAARAWISASNQQNNAAVQQARTSLIAASTQEEALVNEVNAYCRSE